MWRENRMKKLTKQPNLVLFSRFQYTIHLCLNLLILLVFTLFFEAKWIVLAFLVFNTVKLIVLFFLIDREFKRFEDWVKYG